MTTKSSPKSPAQKAQQAIALATKAHEGQLRKTGEPYIIHPLAVQKILEDWHMDEDTIIAGILHDTVEDTDLTLKEIEQQFGKDVAFLVNGVTKLGKTRSGMKNLDEYLPQTSDNLLKLLIATGQDIRVLIIKLADRLHNLRTLSALPPAKQQKSPANPSKSSRLSPTVSRWDTSASKSKKPASATSTQNATKN